MGKWTEAALSWRLPYGILPRTKRSPRINSMTSSRMLKTAEMRDLNLIKAMENKIAEKNQRLVELQKGLDKWEAAHRRSLEFQEKFPEAERKALSLRMNKYKKNIGLTSADHPESFAAETERFFASEQAKLDNLESLISDANQRLRKARRLARQSKQLLSALKLPEFKADMLSLNFSTSFEIDTKVFAALKNVEFHKDKIAAIEEQTNHMKQEIKALLPRRPSMKTVKPQKQNISVRCSTEMTGVTSYESARMHAAFKATNEAFRFAKSAPDRLRLKISAINENLTTARSHVLKLRKKTKQPRNTSSPRELSKISMKDVFEERTSRLGLLKDSIKQTEEDIKTVLTDLPPDIRTKSPDGLMRWRDNLLRLKAKNGEEYKEKIQKATIQLNDFKVMCRMNQQRRQNKAELV